MRLRSFVALGLFVGSFPACTDPSLDEPFEDASTDGELDSTDGASLDDDTSTGGETGIVQEAEPIWVRRFPSDPALGTARPLAVATSPTGRIHVAVAADESGAEYLVLLTYDEGGKLLWKQPQSMWGEVERAALSVQGGQIACAATATDFLDGYHAVWVYEADGSLRWSAQGPVQVFGGEAVGVALAGGDVVVATTNRYALDATSGTKGFLVQAYADGGAPAWSWDWAIDDMGSEGHDVLVDPRGGLFVSGQISGRSLVARLDPSGELLWKKFLHEERTYDDVHLSRTADGLLRATSGHSVYVLDGEGEPVDDFALDIGDAHVNHIAWNGDALAAAGRFDGEPGVTIRGESGSLDAQLVDLSLRSATHTAWLPSGDLLLVGYAQTSDDTDQVSIARIASQ